MAHTIERPNQVLIFQGTKRNADRADDALKQANLRTVDRYRFAGLYGCIIVVDVREADAARHAIRNIPGVIIPRDEA